MPGWRSRRRWWSFPGRSGPGRPDPDEDPRRACAVRETTEETGVALAAADLLPWAHWITPILQPIRYDTYFFLAALPPGQEAGDLSSETERAAWTAPARPSRRTGDGVLAMMPPTLSILLELAELSSVAEALGTGPRIASSRPCFPRSSVEADGWMFRYPRRGRGTGG